MKNTIRVVALFLVICMTGMFLIACTPSSIDAAKSKMTKAGYSVEDYSVNSEGVVGGIYAYKGALLSGNRVSINAVLFETEEDAVNAVNNSIFTSPKQDGKWIFFGDEEAIKDFTK